VYLRSEIILNYFSKKAITVYLFRVFHFRNGTGWAVEKGAYFRQKTAFKGKKTPLFDIGKG
jgi:hypothetical protein